MKTVIEMSVCGWDIRNKWSYWTSVLSGVQRYRARCVMEAMEGAARVAEGVVEGVDGKRGNGRWLLV